MLPLEFIPPTVVVIIAAVVWLLARLNRQMTARTETAGPVDSFADIEQIFEPGPEELPADEAADVHQQFAVIAAINPYLDKRFKAIVAAAQAIPAQRSEDDPR